MSKYNCYLCATDEGIPLDIFGDAGKTFRENIETCLSVKIKRSEAPSNKICHKCAYELESCGQFVGNYRRCRGRFKEGCPPKRGNCGLCGETGKNVRLLRIDKGNALNNSLSKIGRVFDDDFFKDDIENLCVCLDCRYNLDVLYDLKSIYHETRDKLISVKEEGVEASDLPKTRTSVVSRKTTRIPLPKLNGNRDYDSGASTVSSDMSLKRKRGRPRKDSVVSTAETSATTTSQFRSCEECAARTEYGTDMYRYHRTGLTVCKDCWVTMDPEKLSNGKRERLGRADPGTGDTKLCAVILKDVLSNPSKYNNIYKVERDKHGNTTFLITDESSENETPPKRLRGRASTSSSVVAEQPVTRKRRAAKRLTTEIDKNEPPKKSAMTRRSNQRSSELPTVANKTRTRNDDDDEDDDDDDDDVVIIETNSRIVNTRGRRGSVESTTKSDISRVGKKRIGRTSAAAKKIHSDEKSQTGGESSSNSRGEARQSTRITRGKTSSLVDKVDKPPPPPPRGRATRTRSNSLSSRETMTATNRVDESSEKPPTPPSLSPPAVEHIETKKKRSKNAKSDSELEKPYKCSVCLVGYKNKLIGKAHELTHEKQPEVKLRRVVLEPPDIDEINTEISPLVEKPEERTRDASGGRSLEKNENLEDERTLVTDDITVPNDSAETERSSPIIASEELKLDDDDETEETIEEKECNETNEIPTVRDEDACRDDSPEEKRTDENKENEENDDSESRENDENENKENDKTELVDEPSMVTECCAIDPSTRDESEKLGTDSTPCSENVEKKMENIEEENENIEEQSEKIEEQSEKIEEQSEKIEEEKEKIEEEKEKIEEEKENIESSEIFHGDKVEPEENKNVEVNGKRVDQGPVETIDETSEDIEKEIPVDGETICKIVVTETLEESNGVASVTTEPAAESLESVDEINEPAKREDTTRDDSLENEKEKKRDDDDDDEDKMDERDDDESARTNVAETEEETKTNEESSEPVSIVTEILREVFDLASAEVKKRRENKNPNDEKISTPETLENISLEIQNSADALQPDQQQAETSGNDKS